MTFGLNHLSRKLEIWYFENIYMFDVLLNWMSEIEIELMSTFTV
jgi:hypothetical protein